MGPPTRKPSICNARKRLRRSRKVRLSPARKAASRCGRVPVRIPSSSQARQSSSRLRGPDEAMHEYAICAASSIRARVSPSSSKERIHVRYRWRSSCRSQWWSFALVTWIVPRIGHERTSSADSKASSIALTEGCLTRRLIAHGIEEGSCACKASILSTAATGLSAAVSATRPWLIMRARLRLSAV